MASCIKQSLQSTSLEVPQYFLQQMYCLPVLIQDLVFDWRFCSAKVNQSIWMHSQLKVYHTLNKIQFFLSFRIINNILESKQLIFGKTNYSQIYKQLQQNGLNKFCMKNQQSTWLKQIELNQYDLQSMPIAVRDQQVNQQSIFKQFNLLEKKRGYQKCIASLKKYKEKVTHMKSLELPMRQKRSQSIIKQQNHLKNASKKFKQVVKNLNLQSAAIGNTMSKRLKKVKIEFDKEIDTIEQQNQKQAITIHKYPMNFASKIQKKLKLRQRMRKKLKLNSKPFESSQSDLFAHQPSQNSIKESFYHSNTQFVPKFPITPINIGHQRNKRHRTLHKRAFSSKQVINQSSGQEHNIDEHLDNLFKNHYIMDRTLTHFYAKTIQFDPKSSSILVDNSIHNLTHSYKNLSKKYNTIRISKKF